MCNCDKKCEQDCLGLISALADCRDAMPPGYADGSRAIGDPLAVPEFIRATQKALDDEYDEAVGDKEDAEAFSSEMVGAILHLTGQDKNPNLNQDDEFSVNDLVDMLECWKEGREWG
jgi:hypothetical protein